MLQDKPCERPANPTGPLTAPKVAQDARNFGVVRTVCRGCEPGTQRPYG